MSKNANDAWVNAHYGHDAHPIVDNKPHAAPGIEADIPELLAELRDVEDYFKDVDPNPIHLATVQQAIELIDASPKRGSMSDCPIIRLAPGEYTDWGKRVWRRGVIEAVTQPDIALAANMSALIDR